MIRIGRGCAASLAVVVLGLAAPAWGAVYKGHSVDDRRYAASLTHPDYGSYENLEVKFQGETAFVYFRGGGRIVLTLNEEEISDPHHIQAQDLRRGITWELNVQGLGSS